ncbi:MAG: hypothetical protein FJX62_21020, partial [Alphaproteobacteria bacterium]|nr:hypothetical protein [Alphaproteobacteria bacterium]
MITADPQIAGAADRLLWRFGRVIEIAVGVGVDQQQFVELVGIEAGQRQVEACVTQITKFEPQQFVAPLTRFRQPIVGNGVSLALRLGPAARDDGRHLGDAF